MIEGACILLVGFFVGYMIGKSAQTFKQLEMRENYPEVFMALEQLTTNVQLQTKKCKNCGHAR